MASTFVFARNITNFYILHLYCKHHVLECNTVSIQDLHLALLIFYLYYNTSLVLDKKRLINGT